PQEEGFVGADLQRAVVHADLRHAVHPEDNPRPPVVEPLRSKRAGRRPHPCDDPGVVGGGLDRPPLRFRRERPPRQGAQRVRRAGRGHVGRSAHGRLVHRLGSRRRPRMMESADAVSTGLHEE
ncbi:hypothetical protein ABE10_00100, partial [Bacillus toyonensis]|nr:hypothetical protein [Bacillus toyonensis]